MSYILIKSILLPPVGLFVLILLAVFWWRRPLLGRGMAALCALGLLGLSCPMGAAYLAQGLEAYPALGQAELAAPRAHAILVLSAGRYSDSLEYGGDDVDFLTLQRMRYAAWLHKRTGLPVIVSGGGGEEGEPSLADLMARVLEQEFAVPVMAREGRSRNTRENARYSALLLREHAINTVYLVSHAWHLPRAVGQFLKAGVDVIPAPTVFAYREGEAGEPPSLGDFMPSGQALLTSHYVVHEYLGRVWYRLTE